MLLIKCDHPNCDAFTKAIQFYEDTSAEDPGWEVSYNGDYCPAHEVIYWRAKHGPITEHEWRQGQMLRQISQRYVESMLITAPMFKKFADTRPGETVAFKVQKQ